MAANAITTRTNQQLADFFKGLAATLEAGSGVTLPTNPDTLAGINVGLAFVNDVQTGNDNIVRLTDLIETAIEDEYVNIR